MRWRYRAVALVVGAMLMFGVVGLGAAFATDQPPSPAGYREIMLSKVAAMLGVDEQQVSAAFVQAHKEMLDEAVKDGRLTQQQAEWMQQRMQQGGFGPGFGPGMRGGPMHRWENGSWPMGPAPGR